MFLPPDFSSLAREVTASLHSEESSERPSLNARAKTSPCCVLWPPRCAALQSPGRSPGRSFPRHSGVPRHPQGLTHSEREANVLSKQKGVCLSCHYTPQRAGLKQHRRFSRNDFSHRSEGCTSWVKLPTDFVTGGGPLPGLQTTVFSL